MREPTALPTQHVKGALKWQQHKYNVLRWNLVTAQLMLQGASAQMLLGDEFILLRGEHRAPMSPLPGMDNVTIVQVLDNPDRLGAQDIFMAVAT